MENFPCKRGQLGSEPAIFFLLVSACFAFNLIRYMVQKSLRALRKCFILSTLCIRRILKVERECPISEEGQLAVEAWLFPCCQAWPLSRLRAVGGVGLISVLIWWLGLLPPSKKGNNAPKITLGSRYNARERCVNNRIGKSSFPGPWPGPWEFHGLRPALMYPSARSSGDREFLAGYLPRAPSSLISLSCVTCSVPPNSTREPARFFFPEGSLAVGELSQRAQYPEWLLSPELQVPVKWSHLLPDTIWLKS